MLAMLTTLLSACSCAPSEDEKSIKELKALVDRQSPQQQAIMNQRRLLEEQTRLDKEAQQQNRKLEKQRAKQAQQSIDTQNKETFERIYQLNQQYITQRDSPSSKRYNGKRGEER